MNDKEKYEIMIPYYVILALAKLLLPDIQKYYYSEIENPVMQ